METLFKPPEEIVRFITNSIYHLRQRKMPRRKWRAIIAKDAVYHAGFMGRSEEFCKTWDHLESKNLIPKR